MQRLSFSGFLLFCLLFASTASAAHIISVFPSNDTTISSHSAAGFAAYPINFYNVNRQGVDTYNQTFLLTSWWNSADLPSECDSGTWMKLSNSTIDGLIYTGNNFIFNGSGYDLGLQTFTSVGVRLNYISNTSWTDIGITNVNKPAGTPTNSLGSPNFIANYTASGNFSGWTVSPSFNITNTTMLDQLYKGNPVTIFTCAENSGIQSRASLLTSLESPSPEYFNMTLADFIEFKETATDVHAVYIDFESGAISTVPFPEYDVYISLDVDAMTSPLPVQFSRNEANTDDTVLNSACSSLNNWADPFTLISDIRTNRFSDGYDTYCVNLTSRHNGQPFYGAIKFLNMSNVRAGGNFDFDAFTATFAPHYVTITPVRFSPSQPVTNNVVLFSWDTTIPMNSTFWFRVKPSGATNFSEYIPRSRTNFDLHQSSFLNPTEVISGEYQFFAEGFSNDSLSHAVSPVGGFNTTVVGSTGTGISSGISIRVKDQSNFPLRAGIIFDNLPPVQTASIPDNSSFTGVSEVYTFYGQTNSSHTVTVYATGYKNSTQNFSVASQPFTLDVKLTPQSTCLYLYYNQYQDQCEQHTAAISSTSQLNFTSWYCQWDSQGCTQFDGNGTCIQNPIGLWKGYGCLDYYRPTGAPINASIPIGSSLNGTSGGTVAGGLDIVAFIFGTSRQNAQGFVAMLITMIITIIVGIKVKDGLVTAIIFLGMIGTFFMIGWLPVWMIIILVISAAFLIAKFVRQSVTNQ